MTSKLPSKRSSKRPPAPKEEAPKARGSDTYLAFAQACDEAIEALEAYGVDKLGENDEGRILLSEFRDQATFLMTWKARPPNSVDKRAAIDRILKLHARASVYLDRRQRQLAGEPPGETLVPASAPASEPDKPKA